MDNILIAGFFSTLLSILLFASNYRLEIVFRKKIRRIDEKLKNINMDGKTKENDSIYPSDVEFIRTDFSKEDCTKPTTGVIELIKQKFLCLHDWEHVDTVQTANIFGIERLVFIVICRKCGKIKKIKVRN